MFHAAAGQVRGAVGVSLEKSSLRYQEYQNALSDTNTASTTNDRTTRRETQSAYMELFVPLVGSENAVRGIERLDLSLATRYDDYSDFGDTTNPKVAVVWSPGAGLSLRATWGKSFRAPSLVDIGNLNFAFIGDVADPANPPNQIRQLSYNGSNPDLDPETAETFSYGLISPHSCRTFDLAHHYKVEYRDRIRHLRQAATKRSTAVHHAQSALGGDPTIPTRALVSTPQPRIRSACSWMAVAQNRSLTRTHRLRRALPQDTKFGCLCREPAAQQDLRHHSGTTPGACHGCRRHFGNPIGDRGRVNLAGCADRWQRMCSTTTQGLLNTAYHAERKGRIAEPIDLNLAFQTEMGNRVERGAGRMNIQNLMDKDPPIVLNGGTLGHTRQPDRALSLVDLSKNW